MRIHAQSPCRVDLAGGTLDIWPLYLFLENAVTMNVAVDRYTRCTLTTRGDARIILRSRDLNLTEEFASYEALARSKKYQLALLALQVRYWRPEGGLEVDTESEAPAGAGISGSSALMISLAAAFNKLMHTRHSLERIREIAQNIEAQIIRVPTGCQDYYPAMYGGVSAIEMGPGGVKRVAVPVDYEEFNQRMVLAYTGVPRDSGVNNWTVNKKFIDGDAGVRTNFHEIAAISNGVRKALAKADWSGLARLIRAEWSHRKKNAPGITTPEIERLVELTAKAGAKAAKVCGAGGGGCVFFLVQKGAKARVQQTIAGAGARVLEVRIAEQGVRVRVER